MRPAALHAVLAAIALLLPSVAARGAPVVSSKESSSRVTTWPLGGRLHFYSENDFDDGTRVETERSESGMWARSLAQADWGVQKVLARASISSDSWSSAVASSSASYTDYTVYSAIQGNVISNIAHFEFTLRGTVQDVVDEGFVILDFSFQVNGDSLIDYYWVYDSSEPDLGAKDFSELLTGTYVFEIDRVLELKAELYLVAGVPGSAAKNTSYQGSSNAYFDSTVVFSGLTLPEGVEATWTASGATYPVDLDVLVPEPSTFVLMALTLAPLLVWRRARRRGGSED